MKDHAAARGAIKSADQPKQRGLSTTGWPHQDRHRTSANIKRGAGQCDTTVVIDATNLRDFNPLEHAGILRSPKEQQQATHLVNAL